MTRGVAIVGCGLVGAKRARALPAGWKVAAVFDRDADRARELAGTAGPSTRVATSLDEAVRTDGVELVIVATPHDQLAPSALEAVGAGCHVLVEKPGANRLEPLLELRAAADAAGRVVRVGFNHRFHPAIRRARTLAEEAGYGPVLSVRARYGHGGRLGYEKEWRAVRSVSGGGELIDQGMHLIDLTRGFLGDVTLAFSELRTDFWPMEVEDNAYLALRGDAGAFAWLHASWTEWKNLFSFEVALERGQAGGHGSRRQLRRRAPHGLRDESGDGSTGDDDRGVAGRRPLVARRARRRRRRPRRAPGDRRDPRRLHRGVPDRRGGVPPMIITRTPLRISLGGGGTDLPSYYRKSGKGFLIAAAITKYVYIAVNHNFDDDILLKYSQVERVPDPTQVEHPLLRECLLCTGVPTAVEISSMADIPAGTGLGSSGAFTVGVLQRAARVPAARSCRTRSSPREACEIEIDRLGEPIGKQDQYIAAVGGLTAFEFRDDESVGVSPGAGQRRGPALPRGQSPALLHRAFGGRRPRSSRTSRSPTTRRASSLEANLDAVRDLGYRTHDALVDGDLAAFGALLTEQWQLKFDRSPTAIHRTVDDWIRDRCRRRARSAASSSAPVAAASSSSTPRTRRACGPR